MYEFLQSVSRQVWDRSYRLKDGDENPVDHEVEDTLHRVAKALAEQEPMEEREQWESEFLAAMLKGAIPGGRIISAAGAQEYKPSTSTLNCLVAPTIPDSMTGILEVAKLAGEALQRGSGIGYNFTTIRPKGARVSGAGARTSGPLSFMEIFDSVCATVSSAGNRRGAQMAVMDIYHPDIEAFVVAKREKGFLRKFNLSVGVTKEFLKVLDKDGDWDLYFPVQLNHKVEGRVVWRPWPTKEGYSVNEEGKVLCKVYKTVKARELWDLIMRNTYNHAEPGILLLGRINDFNNLWFDEVINASNPSMVAGTRVWTTEGIREIQELEGKDFRVRTASGEEAQAKCFLSGLSEPIMRVSFGSGLVHFATREHKWPVLEGNVLRRVKTQDLKAGMRVKFPNPGAKWGGSSVASMEEAFLLGWFMGDGCMTDFGERSRNVAFYFSGDEIEIAKRIQRILKSWGRDLQIKQDHECNAWVMQSGSKDLVKRMKDYGVVGKDSLPKEVWKMNSEQTAAFLDGLFSSDGSVRKEGSIALTSSRKGLLLEVLELLSFYGIKGRLKSSETRLRGKIYKCYNLVVSRTMALVFRSVISLSSKAKQSRLDEAGVIREFTKVGFVEVKGVELTDREEKVWDISVDHDDHSFVIGGIVTGNCGEQALPPNGACLLGSINLVRFFDYATCSFDFQSFREVVRVFTRMLDNVVEIHGLAHSEMISEIVRKRRHGMGYFGLGSLMALMGIRYGSPESVSLTESITRAMAHEGWRMSLELAREKGPAPIMEEDFTITQSMVEKNDRVLKFWKIGDTVKGRELIFRCSRYMDGLREVDSKLVEDLANEGGRFTHHTSIAPTGTTAIAFGDNASNGIEPTFAHKYMRNMVVGGRKTREAVPVYSVELLMLSSESGLTPEEVLEGLPESYVVAEGVSPEGHLNVQAAAQKWVDGSISKTVNVPQNISFDEFKRIYEIAIALGVKGCTTYRYNPTENSAVLVTSESANSVMYEITLESGKTLRLRGMDRIEYQGEETTVMNLYEALVEGSYGKLGG